MQCSEQEYYLRLRDDDDDDNLTTGTARLINWHRCYLLIGITWDPHLSSRPRWCQTGSRHLTTPTICCSSTHVLTTSLYLRYTYSGSTSVYTKVTSASCIQPQFIFPLTVGYHSAQRKFTLLPKKAYTLLSRYTRNFTLSSIILPIAS